NFRHISLKPLSNDAQPPGKLFRFSGVRAVYVKRKARFLPKAGLRGRQLGFGSHRLEVGEAKITLQQIVHPVSTEEDVLVHMRKNGIGGGRRFAYAEERKAGDAARLIDADKSGRARRRNC